MGPGHIAIILSAATLLWYWYMSSKDSTSQSQELTRILVLVGLVMGTLTFTVISIFT